ncbi:hypothetical protein HGRIS_002643 [Hohenbuehelia grisea]|uniref:Protein kinase domain-containing protein n=1 Tax=Hohenbuehelia grisea TaxID=104357 RepID=A0ABR3JLL9_9AGAR
MAFWKSNHLQPPDVPTTTTLVENNGGRVLNQYERTDIKLARGASVYPCRLRTVDGLGPYNLVVKYVTYGDPAKRARKFPTKGRTASPDPSPSRPATPVRNLYREIAILKACSGRHPSIVTLFEVISDARYKKSLLVMEFLDGGSVQWRDPAEEKPLLLVEQTRRIMRDVVLGLEFLHFHGIIHRDLKPANFVYVADRTHVKLIDFGISHYSASERKAMANKPESPLAPLNDSSLFPESDLRRQFGTAPFMAPEVVWFPGSQPSSSPNSAAVTSASLSAPSSVILPSLSEGQVPPKGPPLTKALDIWSLGVSFFCMLFGRIPFGDETTNRIHLNNIILSEEWVPEWSMGFDQVPTTPLKPIEASSILGLLDGMLQKDPSKRIDLSSIKSHTWMLDGIANPKEWIRVTTPRAYEAGFQGWFQRLQDRV